MARAQPITPRPTPIDATAAAPFDARQMARDLLRTTRITALATLDRDSGYPYGTMTNLSVEPDGTPVFYAAGLSLHARNIVADPRISLTLAQVSGLDILADRRLTLVGRAIRLEGLGLEMARARYLRRFPKAATYLALKDTMLFRLLVEALHFNGGPARNRDDLTPADLLTDLSEAGDLMAHEAEEIAAMEANRPLLQALTERAGGVRGRWRIATLDPEGIDLAAEAALARIRLPRRVASRNALRETLAEMGFPVLRGGAAKV